MSIYRTSEIWGDAAVELSSALYRKWGQTLGQQNEPGAKFVVGGDTRASTPEFLAALADGLCAAGADVVELGVAPTPVVYYAQRRLRAAGCAVVTGSYHPAGINGLKWRLGRQPPGTTQVDLLRHAANSARRRKCRCRNGNERALDISFDYVGWLQETWVDLLEFPCRVVLDPMYGIGAQRARRYLQAVFPHGLFSAIHDEPRPDFGDQSPDCSRPEALDELASAVEHQQADLGIALDGDADRVAVVDGQGNVLSPDETACVLLESFNGEVEGQSLVYDQESSFRLAELARQHGAEPLAERNDPSAILARMRQMNAFFGAAGNGQYFFRALDGGNDPLFTVCWLISWLAHSHHTLAELRREIPSLAITPSLLVPLGESEQKKVLKEVRRAWADLPQSRLDGVRVDFAKGQWASLRPASGAEGLVFRAEAQDWEQLHRLVHRFCAPLGELGDQLWIRYTAETGNQKTTLCRR